MQHKFINTYLIFWIKLEPIQIYCPVSSSVLRYILNLIQYPGSRLGPGTLFALEFCYRRNGFSTHSHFFKVPIDKFQGSR